jgi:4'-phosphopantetheinyl transferase EntD
LGIRDFALRSAADRQPVWPQGIVGTITHTTGFCAAAVAPGNELLAIGLDSEVVGSPTADIWPTICRTEELDWVNQLAETDRAAAVTLVFSAKEAFYKCQYPLVGEWLDFHDVSVRVAGWGARDGTFSVQAIRPLRFAVHARLPITGRYVFHDEFVSAGVWAAAGFS